MSSPILVYKIFLDGHEELVRGMRFRGFGVRSLKDILAAGDDSSVFEYMDNSAPFALIGGSGYTAEACVVAPSILIDDLELHPAEEELPKLPVVSAPEMTRDKDTPVLRLLGRYIFREILTSAVLGTLLASFILFLRLVDPIFELLVKSNNTSTRLVFELFVLAIPGVLPFTIPFGVLVGILIGLGRMTADGEITAMRAARRLQPDGDYAGPTLRRAWEWAWPGMRRCG